MNPLTSTLKILLRAFLLPLQANACLWVDGTTLDGTHRKVEATAPDSNSVSRASTSPVLFPSKIQNQQSEFFNPLFTSTFDVGRSMFDVQLPPPALLRVAEVHHRAVQDKLHR